MDEEKNIPLHALVIGNDDTVFDPSSSVRRRVGEYALVLGRLTVLCRTRRRDAVLVKEGPLTVYPVHAGNPVAFMRGAYRLGLGIIRGRPSDAWVITSDNPFEEGLVAWRIARKLKVPLQLQVHTDIASPWYRRASWKEWMRWRLAHFLLPRADCIRVVSRRIRDSLVSGFKLPVSRISVLPVWTDVTQFLRAGADPETEARFRGYSFKMVAVGRFLDKEKNFGMLIDGMRDFVKTCPDALLVLVGDGRDRENLKLKIKNLKLQNSVIIEAWRNDLPSFFKAFDVCLVPSNYEGWGRVPVEAMAAGLPVVMTDVGLAGEMVNNGTSGIVVPVGDGKAFFAAVGTLERSPQRRKELAEAGRSAVAEMRPKTWEEYLGLYKKSYEMCLGNDKS